MSLNTAYSAPPISAKAQRRGKAPFAAAPCSASWLFSNSLILCSVRCFSSCAPIPHADWDGYLVCVGNLTSS